MKASDMLARKLRALSEECAGLSESQARALLSVGAVDAAITAARALAAVDRKIAALRGVFEW